MEIAEIEYYTQTVIPKIEKELTDAKKSDEELREIYNLYVEVLRLVARDDFKSFNKYLELDEDHHSDNKAFYHHRKDVMDDVFTAFNDMEIYDKYDLLLISLPPRTGKMQPLYSKLLTPTGWINMGDVKVGDSVISKNGNKTTVTGIFPQGKMDVYEVTFDDDTKVRCGLEHLWTVKTRDDRCNGKERTIPLKDMIDNLYVENGTRKNYSIDYVKPVEFSNELSNDDLHPYLLGALIGDGGLSCGGIKFTNIDSELIETLQGLISDDEKITRISNTISFGITSKNVVRDSKGYPTKCKTDKKISEYGLKVTSEHKFIPEQYKRISVKERLELLQGLMDTDGYCSGSYCEYTTVSRQLAEDVVELIRSLGGRTSGVTEKETGKKLAYRIQFNMELNPFKLSRKANKFKPRATRTVKYIKSIELVDNAECQCIMVDDESHLYVTDGYNLTHNTTTGIRFLSWIMGRYPEDSQLGTSYSDNITSSFYAGAMEIVLSERFQQIFPDATLVNQNAKREEIWLKVIKRYPSITFVPINGSMTGRCEASKYLYCDDLVSGIEEAMSLQRMEKLWQTYTVNCKQRKKDGCKEVHVATKWSVHDVITKLGFENANNPRCKIINMSCYDDDGESNFNFEGGFSTKYYNDLEDTMDSVSFSALYKQVPIEREGLLYHPEDLQYYFTLPNTRPDTIIAICDSKNMGNDFVCSPVGYVYGDTVYIEDVVFNNGLPDVTRPLVADAWVRNNVVRADVEMNNGGNYYAEDLDNLIRAQGGHTSIRMFFTGNNKTTKIITYSDFVKKHFVFKDPSTYSKNSEYATFMNALFTWTQSGGNKQHDDAPDGVAMLAQLTQELSGCYVKILDRRMLGL